ncbi:MAG: phosphoribosylglycinamide formyltransferase [Eubacteriales bacterium]
MLNLGVLVSGGGTNLQAIFDRIESRELNNVQISIIISSNPKAYALERAEKYGVKNIIINPKEFETRELFNKKLIKALKEAEVDLVVLAGYLVVLDEEIVCAFKNKIINVHPSLIPSFCGKGYYGLKVHQAAIDKGVKVSGATVHIVDEGTDTGPIIMQQVVEVKQDDTPMTLQKRVMEEAEWVILPKAIQLFADNVVSIKGKKVFINS